MTEHRWLDSALHELAAATEYPTTPDLAVPMERPRRPVHGYALAMVLMAAVGLAIPPVRSAVIDWVQAGAVTLIRWLGDEEVPSGPPVDQFLSRFARTVSLSEAQAATDHELVLPTLPRGLGTPDEIWMLDDHAGPTVISIWRQSQGEVRLVFYQIASDQLVWKSVKEWEETQVNGGRAIWTSGPHLMRLPGNQWETWALIEDNVLIWWTRDGVTYRLETRSGREEAIAIAESLQALPETKP